MYFSFLAYQRHVQLGDTLDTLTKALIALNWLGATWAAALDISNAFDSIKHAGYLQKLKSYGISGQVFDLISFFLVIIIDGFK